MNLSRNIEGHTYETYHRWYTNSRCWLIGNDLLPLCYFPQQESFCTTVTTSQLKAIARKKFCDQKMSISFSVRKRFCNLKSSIQNRSRGRKGGGEKMCRAHFAILLVTPRRYLWRPAMCFQDLWSFDEWNSHCALKTCKAFWKYWWNLWCCYEIWNLLFSLMLHLEDLKNLQISLETSVVLTNLQSTLQTRDVKFCHTTSFTTSNTATNVYDVLYTSRRDNKICSGFWSEKTQLRLKSAKFINSRDLNRTQNR